MGCLPYLPILRSRGAEWVALGQLDPQVDARMLPLVEVAAPPTDGTRPLTAGQWLVEVCEQAAENRPLGSVLVIDPHPLARAAGVHPGELWRLLTELAPLFGPRLCPVLRLDDNERTLSIAGDLARGGGTGGCLRLDGPILRPGSAIPRTPWLFRKRVAWLLHQCDLQPDEVDLVLDLGALRPQRSVAAMAEVVGHLVDNLPCWGSWRRVIVIGTSAPPTVTDFPFGVTRIPRVEWQLWRALRDCSPGVEVGFGDYAGQGAALPGGFRPRHPALRYTGRETLFVARAEAGDGDGYHSFAQVCRQVVDGADYAGPSFSWADQVIHDIATGRAPAPGGGPSRWKQLSICHHLTRVANDLARPPAW